MQAGDYDESEIARLTREIEEFKSKLKSSEAAFQAGVALHDLVVLERTKAERERDEARDLAGIILAQIEKDRKERRVVTAYCTHGGRIVNGEIIECIHCAILAVDARHSAL